MYSKYKKGFTLIELLVVISIISLLSSIMLVSLNNVRVKARDAVRIMDMEQLSKALMMYYNAHGKYPLDTDAEIILTGYAWWNNYNKMAEILVSEGF